MARRIHRALALAALLAAFAVSCNPGNGCEEALDQTEQATQDVCDDGAYAATAFCTTCVAAGYYSTTGPTDCRCTLLAYDQGTCAIPSDDEAKASVREAIKWANESCTTFTIGDSGEGGAGGSGDPTPGGSGGA
jgi:hypothetical protein